MKPVCRIASFYTIELQKNIDCGRYNTVYDTNVCFYQQCFGQEARPALTEEDIHCGTENREIDEMRKQLK